jgi:hypothetical protein
MTESEFYALSQGDQFEREGKPYTVLKIEGKSQVAHPAGNPRLLIHFRPQQASQMTRIESEPERHSLCPHTDFPCYKNLRLRFRPRIHPEPESRFLCLALDGFLTEPRQGSEIGSPVAAAIDFVLSAHHAGYQLQICTDRPQQIVWDWLRIHCHGLESLIHVSPALPPPATPYLSRYAWTIEEAKRTLAELSKQEHHE